MSTDIKPGQTWRWNDLGRHWAREFRIQGVQPTDEFGPVFVCVYPDHPMTWTVREPVLRANAHLVSDPNALNPDDVRPGDVVTLTGQRGSSLVNLEVGSVYDVTIGGRRVYLADLYAEGWTLTGRQIATQEPTEAHKPGTPAEIEAPSIVGDLPVNAVRSTGRTVTGWYTPYGFVPDRSVTAVRPLTLLDPSSAEQTTAEAIQASADMARTHWITKAGALRLAKAVLVALEIKETT